MFCSKCGTQLNDDAAFCSACGNAVAQPQAAPVETPVTPAEQAPVQAPVQTTPQAPATSSLPAGLVTIPKISEFIVLGLSALMFIFMFLPWFKYGAKMFGISYFKHFSIFTDDLFELSAIMGIAKVLGIINIIVFVIFALLYFFDARKLIPTIPEKLDLKKYSAYAFGGIYALQWILTLIGMIATEYVGLSICFIFALIFAAAFAVAVLMPDLLDKLLKDVLKIKKD